MKTETLVKNPTAKWYVNLCARFNDIMDRNGMPEEISAEIKLFVLDIAKEQYRAGNKAGCAWMREQLLGKQSST